MMPSLPKGLSKVHPFHREHPGRGRTNILSHQIGCDCNAWCKPRRNRWGDMSVILWRGKSGNELKWVWLGIIWIRCPAFSITLNSDQDVAPALRCSPESGMADWGSSRLLDPTAQPKLRNNTTHHVPGFSSCRSLFWYMNVYNSYSSLSSTFKTVYLNLCNHAGFLVMHVAHFDSRMCPWLNQN